jgi:DNA modification methylase
MTAVAKRTRSHRVNPGDGLAVAYWPIERMVPYARNARSHSEAQVAEIAGSIRAFGFVNPILVGEEGDIVAGHGRLAAARMLGLKQVPVIVLRGLSEVQRRQLVLADNRIAQNAGWDLEMLALELKDLSALGADLSLLGFDEKELEAALAPEVREGLTDEDDVPDVGAAPVSRLGDLWLLGPHRLICGDCTNAEAVAVLLGDVRPNLMVTDPPYGVGYDPEWRAKAGLNKNRAKLGKVANDDRADWREAWQLFPGAVAYVWSAPGPLQIRSYESLVAAGFEVRQQLIWAKDRFALGRGHYHYQHEPCWYAVRKKGNWTGGRSQTSLWQIKSREDGGHGHGTQKPVECMRRPILNNSSPGQAIYDPFLGSGTTLIAAESTARVCFGMEIEPPYVDVAVRRWQAFTGKPATLQTDDRTFDAIAEERLAQEPVEA